MNPAAASAYSARLFGRSGTQTRYRWTAAVNDAAAAIRTRIGILELPRSERRWVIVSLLAAE